MVIDLSPISDNLMAAWYDCVFMSREIMVCYCYGT
jgi:hypothetical protein